MIRTNSGSGSNRNPFQNVIKIGTTEGGRTFRIDFDNDTRRQINSVLRDNVNSQLFANHARLQQERMERNRSNRGPRTGSVSLSNADSVTRAERIRARLLAKLQEVVASDMEPRARDALAADIQMQINRVCQKIAAIRRREQAIIEERTAHRRAESENERRRRRHDIQERRIYIREDLLYPASQGGLDPAAFTFQHNPFSPVSFNVGGVVGMADMPVVSDVSMDIVV